MYQYTAWLTAFVDGDTVHAGIDCGLDIATQQTLRFYGINAPEIGTPEGKLAAAFVQAWFHDKCPNGKFVLQTVKDKREKYGRYLATIYPQGDEAMAQESLNDALVRTHNAVPYFPKVAE